MRFATPQPRKRNDDEGILPLTNVIFLLIIFFMLVGSLANPNALAIQPPRSASEAAAGNVGLLVEISTDGVIVVNEAIVDGDQLEATVGDFLLAHPNAPIQLKADGLTNASRVIAVMAELRDAGAEHIRLLTMDTNG